MKAKPIDVIKHFALFLLALIISGVMALSHVSAGATAPSDIGITRVTELKSVDLPDSKTVEGEGISMNISVPYFILPIPEKKLDISSPLSFVVSIANNTQNFIRADNDTLIPELVGQDGRSLPLQISRDRQSKMRNLCWLVEPGTTRLFRSGGLAWNNNKLQLRGDAGLGYFWYFDELKPGEYQLRFIYDSPGGKVSCYDVETQKLMTVKGLGKGEGATNFIPIRVVQPVSINSNTLEIDGIRFELFMPERVLTIPSNQPNAATFVKLALRITNKTVTSLRFQQLNTTLQILGQDGKKLRWKGRGGGNLLAGYNCPLVEPGENVTFSLDAKLFWENNLLLLGRSERSGGFIYFDEFKPGKYQIRIGYNPGAEVSCTQELSGDTWKGLGATPFVGFNLVEH
ncbi:histidine kinase [Oscillatoria nigro-viridis]|uniref:histidine kinase n=1 Tax=Phormidium nigroviride TaxID=482564 RepID=UPI001CBC13D6|nr:histidine kinase [Oscillatoria nigro-viridis]